MFVGKDMTQNLITITSEKLLTEAAELLKKYRIHHLPVVQGEKLIGIITDTDIRNAVVNNKHDNEPESITLSSIKVSDVMVTNLVTITPEDFLEDALLILSEKRFGALPVVEDEKLVGIITKADILKAFIKILGVENIGVRLQISIPDNLSKYDELLHLLKKLDVEIISIILSPPINNNRFVFLRISSINTLKIKEMLEEKGFKIVKLSDFL